MMMYYIFLDMITIFVILVFLKILLVLSNAQDAVNYGVTVHTCYILTSPPIPSSPCNHIVILRPNFVLHRQRANPSPPPCYDLKIDLFFIFHLFTWGFLNSFFIFPNVIKWKKSRELIPCKRLKDM
jgi:hypothetical protein